MLFLTFVAVCLAAATYWEVSQIFPHQLQDQFYQAQYQRLKDNLLYTQKQLESVVAKNRDLMAGGKYWKDQLQNLESTFHNQTQNLQQTLVDSYNALISDLERRFEHQFVALTNKNN